jgi:hypothetical protein
VTSRLAEFTELQVTGREKIGNVIRPVNFPSWRGSHYLNFSSLGASHQWGTGANPRGPAVVLWLSSERGVHGSIPRAMAG